jgi:outer membrane protein TolC
MNRCLFKRFAAGFLCALYLPGAVTAEPSNLAWRNWLIGQLQSHPAVIAAKEQKNAAFSKADGKTKALYNPELESEFEQEGDANNYTVGISQTIDWWDKRGIRSQQAEYSRAAALQAYELVWQQKIADSLESMVEWQAASKQSELAIQQETQMETLITIIRDRKKAGDLSQVDAELALLNFSQKLNETAHAQVRLRQAEAKLRELLPDWSPRQTEIPSELWIQAIAQARAQWVDKHPVVVAAKAEWEALQKSSKLAALDAKAEPTFGLNAGKSGEDNVVALSFSMPLNIRNNFSAEVQAANQEALSAESLYRAIRRKQLFAIESSRASLDEFQQRYQRLNTLMRGRGERAESLLEKQWRSGDLSTTEYLLALQQRAEGLVAGIELQTQYRLARIDWLFQTGQLNTLLKQL